MPENRDENKVLRDVLSGLHEEIPPMPEDLHAAWMQKVEEDAMQKKPQPTRTPWMKKATRYLSVAAALVFVIGGTALTRDQLSNLGLTADQRSQPALGSAIANSSYTYAAAGARDTLYVDGVVEEMADYSVLQTANAKTRVAADTSDELASALAQYEQIEKKIIRTASLTIATRTYEDSLAALKNTCEQSGGWMQSSSESVSSYDGLRTAHLTLRIPQTALDGYLTDAGTLGRITHRSESATDVTESYQDTAARLSTQEALMDRLQSLITESGDLSDLLALESQIADTQYEIDRLRSSLNSTDRQVTYSTVEISLREENVPDPADGTVSFLERIRAAVLLGWDAFVSFLSDMALFLVAALPFIAIVAIVAIVYFAGRAVLRIKRRNK